MTAALNPKNQMLSQQRCYHHRRREAVVRCPECGHYFCRECVTEHGQRMLCSTCLTKAKQEHPAGERTWFRKVGLFIQGCLGFILIWYAFYLIGLMLLAIPDAFHEGTVWESGWWENQ
jgi:hypothetical protein